MIKLNPLKELLEKSYKMQVTTLLLSRLDKKYKNEKDFINQLTLQETLYLQMFLPAMIVELAFRPEDKQMKKFYICLVNLWILGFERPLNEAIDLGVAERNRIIHHTMELKKQNAIPKFS